MYPTGFFNLKWIDFFRLFKLKRAIYSFKRFILPVRSGSPPPRRVCFHSHLAPEPVSQPPEVPKADWGIISHWTWTYSSVDKTESETAPVENPSDWGLVTDDDVMLICSLPCCRQGRRGQAVTAMGHVWEQWEPEGQSMSLLNKPSFYLWSGRTVSIFEVGLLIAGSPQTDPSTIHILPLSVCPAPSPLQTNRSSVSLYKWS